MINQQLFFSIFSLAHKNPLLDLLLIFGATYLIFFTFLLVSALVVRNKEKERQTAFLIIISLIIAEIIINFIHIFIQEPRPYITLHITPLISGVNSPAFPSVHTTIMAVVAASYYFRRSKLAPIFLILFLIVAFSRIAVGVHYPFDIIVGIFVGVTSATTGFALQKRLLKKLGSFLR